MKHEPKLALTKGVIRRLPGAGVIEAARRVFESSADRANPTPLRDLDRWSDQTEVAFYEDLHGRRA